MSEDEVQVPDPNSHIRTILISWPMGEEPSISAPGISGWELTAVLERSLDIIEMARTMVEKEMQEEEEEE